MLRQLLAVVSFCWLTALCVLLLQMIHREFSGPNALKIMESLDDLAALELKYASPEILSGATVGAAAGAQGMVLNGGSRSSSTDVSRQSSFTGGIAEAYSLIGSCTGYLRTMTACKHWLHLHNNAQ